MRQRLLPNCTTRYTNRRCRTLSCWNTDTGSGGYTHKFFRVAKSADDLRQQRDAIAEWSRLSYGWMGRTPDYKAAFGCALALMSGFYGQFEQNARNWYTRIQETGLYLMMRSLTHRSIVICRPIK